VQHRYFVGYCKSSFFKPCCGDANHYTHSLGLGLATNVDDTGGESQIQIGNVTDMTVHSLTDEETGSLDQIFDHLDPQQWLTPSSVSWGHWDLPLNSAQGS
jgi:pantoate kinase